MAFSKNKIVFILLLVVFLIVGFAYLTKTYNKVPLEVITSVKNYQFETSANKTLGITFQYPKQLLTKYINTVDWPPKVTVTDGPLVCIENGSEITNAGKTEKQTIGNNIYCVTKKTEGAAGSIYTQYIYSTFKNNKVVTLTFTLQAVQCENYSDPQKTECKNEQSNFDINTIVNNIFSTLQFMNNIIKEKSGIQGTVLLGPTCPVVRNPPDPQCADRLYATKLDVLINGQTQIFKEFSSDNLGKFSVEVPEGEYEIKGAASSNILPRCSSSGIIKVVPNTYTDVKIYCDTGIR